VNYSRGWFDVEPQERSETVERLFDCVGFTDQLVEILDHYQLANWRPGDNYIRFKGMPAEVLIALAEKLPEGNLRERQNEGPTIEEFIALALQEPASLFGGYIITKVRDDERLMVDEVSVPTCLNLANRAIASYLPADEDDVVGDFMRRLWWD
jgi:hypothetical protein